MSGGHFDYNQFQIEQIASDIEELIRNNKVKDEYGYCSNYSKKTINKFKTAVKKLRTAAIFAQRIDWLVSGDDGEDTFHKRLKEDLNKL